MAVLGNRFCFLWYYAVMVWFVCVQAPTVCDEAMEVSIKIAHILLDAGCDVSQTTNVGKTPVSMALQQVNGMY